MPGRAGRGVSHLMLSTCCRWMGAFALLFCLCLIGPGPATARAQETPTAEADADAPGKAEGTETFLRWMIRASGPIGLGLLLMSFYLIALVAWMGFHYRRSIALPERLLRDVADLLSMKQYTEAYARLSADSPRPTRLKSTCRCSWCSSRSRWSTSAWSTDRSRRSWWTCSRP